MATFTASPIPSTFGNVLYNPMAVDAAVQAGQRNDLLMQGERQSMDFAAQKNPLELLQMRQALGLEASPGVDALNKLYPGTQPAASATPTAPGSFQQKMGASESGNDPSQVNHGGFSGQFQMGKARMADLGYYQPVPGENMKSPDWPGKVTVPGFNVTNQADFLKNPAAQHVVFGTHVADIDQAIANTPGAAKLDPNGLRAVAHLGGVGGMQRFISTGGLYDPADANGTKLSDYYTKFAAGGAPALQQAFGAPHGPAGPGAAPGGGVAGRIPGAVDVAGPGAGPAPGYGPDGQPLAAGTWNASPAAVGAPAPAAGPAPGAGAPAPAPAAAATAATPATGVNSPQVQQAQQYSRQATQIEMVAAQYPNDPRVQKTAAAMAQDLRGRAQMLLQADSVVQGPGGVQIHTLTGKADDAAKPLSHFVQDPQTGTWYDTAGVTKPEIPRPPSLFGTPGGDVIQGAYGGRPASVVYTTPPDRLAEQEAAKAQGAAAGSIAGKSVKEMGDRAQTTAAAAGNIEYGLSQLDKAAAGGINTGYFSGALTTIQSGLKSLGLPTDKIPFINVSPDAIGNIQTARKTLGVVSGAILQQIIGKDAAMTDAKIEHFIHSQPDITTDPQALRRVLNWAHAGFVYENEMSMAGMKAASGTGMVPLNFLPKYITEHGSGPFFNPSTGEMEQPDGRSPSREPPAASASQPAAYQENQTATGPNGARMVFRQGKWGPM